MVLRQCLIGAILLIISANGVAKNKPSTQPSIQAVDCTKLSQAGVISEQNPVPCERLRRVVFSHATETGLEQDIGELIVLDVVAEHTGQLMQALHQRGFMIARARPIENYGGDDKRSMADNNSSAFNGRKITNGTRWSMHAFGAAIDINPLQNPYIAINKDGTATILPVASARYSVNRSENRAKKSPRPGMVEPVVDLFAEHGFFVWGGDWNAPIDYQHFQIGPRTFIQELITLKPEEGRRLLQSHIQRYKTCKAKQQGLSDIRVRVICTEQVIAAMKQ